MSSAYYSVQEVPVRKLPPTSFGTKVLIVFNQTISQDLGQQTKGS